MGIMCKANSALRCIRAISSISTAGSNVTLTSNMSTVADPLARFKELAAKTQKKPRVLITGSLGQLGRGLASMLRFMYGQDSVVMTDIVKAPRDESIAPYHYLDILDQSAIEESVVNGNIDTLVHFSALLSAVGENNVPLALKVNGQGVQNVLEVGKHYNIQVFIPSTIGAFGPTTPRDQTPDLCVQRPQTIYGVTKVYAELLGEYYHTRFGVDFRSVRFPGIISAVKPGGGTTGICLGRLGLNKKSGIPQKKMLQGVNIECAEIDYAIQIFYDALQYGKHKCYLRPDTMLPMMYDTDCTASVIHILAAPEEQLKKRVYNVTGYSFTPEQIAAAIRKVMPNFKIEYEICPIRQKIADSWPRSLDDSNARKDWGWRNDYDLEATVDIMFQLIEKQMHHEQAYPKKVTH